jgi:hypothetical protein
MVINSLKNHLLNNKMCIKMENQIQYIVSDFYFETVFCKVQLIIVIQTI